VDDIFPGDFWSFWEKALRKADKKIKNRDLPAVFK
jgi:hypothetical protein